MDINEFFKENADAFYINGFGQRRFRGVKGYYEDSLRSNKAFEQAKLPPVPFSKVFAYVNGFLEMLRSDNGREEKVGRSSFLELDNTKQIILDIKME